MCTGMYTWRDMLVEASMLVSAQRCMALFRLVKQLHSCKLAPAANAQVFAGQMPEATFPEVLGRFSEEARLDGTYFLCKQDDMATLARALEKVWRRWCLGSRPERHH